MCKTPIKNAGFGEDCRVFSPNWTFFSEDLPPQKKLFSLPTIPSEFDLDLLSRKSDL